jgi:hypothetical protein
MKEKNPALCSLRSSLSRRALILAAVVSLTISVATRYTTVVRLEAGTKALTSQSLDSERQHLLNDGLHWSAPAAIFVLLEPTRVSFAISPVIFPINRLYPEDLLYSRPPPSC